MSDDDLFAQLGDERLPLPARLDAARQMVAQLEDALAAIKQRALDLVSATPLDDDMIVTLYWEFEDLIPTKALGAFHQMSEVLKERCPWTYPCGSCGAEQRVTSRTQLKALQRPARSYERPKECDQCAERRRERDSDRFERDRAAYRSRLRELKTMPYQQYLDSPEWKERRAARLKAAGYACQVCNGRNKVLNVHHRTYIRRGEEYARDLVVLCQDCHHMFHRNGSLTDGGRGD